MCTRPHHLSLPAFLAIAAPVFGQGLDEARDELAREIQRSDIGTGYAQMLSMFLDRSVSLSRLEVKDYRDNDEMDILKVPLRYDLPIENSDWKLALRGTLSHSRYSSRTYLEDNDYLDAEWRADSGQLGLGLIFPWGEHWSATAVGEAGLSRLKNTADYRGPLIEALAPLLDGVLVNWDTDVAVYSIRSGLDYDRMHGYRSGYRIKARYSYSKIRSFSESSDLPPLRADTQTATLSGEFRHPWGMDVGVFPLFGIVNAGATTFLGDDRDALGFKYYYQAGYSVALDFSASTAWIKTVSIGYQWNQGDNVSGQSLLINWELR
ncbi:Solitary outer membrane autotransporter beta-barrel domain [Haliea sp. E17]|uniref:Solitary outer membrane autotransporter beta-barrel domain n=1 Tax=Haliea sp. E17 TaxID=3401576 RepID=UPI003AAC42D3